MVVCCLAGPEGILVNKFMNDIESKSKSIIKQLLGEATPADVEELERNDPRSEDREVQIANEILAMGVELEKSKDLGKGDYVNRWEKIAAIKRLAKELLWANHKRHLAMRPPPSGPVSGPGLQGRRSPVVKPGTGGLYKYGSVL
jgi:hypothetical protein